MMIYTLTIIKEGMDKLARAETTLYRNAEDAIKAYRKAFEDALYDSQFYQCPNTENELVTDTPYRWWRIYDEGGSYSSIAIELDMKEVY